MGPSKKSPLKRTLYIGNFLWTPSLGQLKVLENAVIGVDESGVMAFVLEGGEIDPMEPARGSGDVQMRFPFLEKVRQHGWKDGEWECVVGGKGGRGWWFPGFVGALLRYLFCRLYSSLSVHGVLLVLSISCDCFHHTGSLHSTIITKCLARSAIRYWHFRARHGVISSCSSAVAGMDGIPSVDFVLVDLKLGLLESLHTRKTSMRLHCKARPIRP